MPISDIKKPKTWKRYRKGMCEGCWGGCCTMPVKVNTEDLFHMGLLKAVEVNGALGAAARRLAARGLVQRFYPKSRTFLLAQRENRDCIFLTRDRLCRIYAKRPLVCREFPQNSRRPGYCPSQRKDGLCGYM